MIQLRALEPDKYPGEFSPDERTFHSITYNRTKGRNQEGNNLKQQQR